MVSLVELKRSCEPRIGLGMSKMSEAGGAKGEKLEGREKTALPERCSS